MKTRCGFLNVLMLLSLPLFFGPLVCAQSVPSPSSAVPVGPSVVIYDGPNFQAPSKSFGIGTYVFRSAEEFNDLASSIKVPTGLGVIVYEHADAGGGYGEWVDFLEDQPNLSRYGFDNRISSLEVFAIRRGNEVYRRNTIENGRFIESRWVRANEVPNSPNPVVAPSPKPPNVPEIISFGAEPTVIVEGHSTTLRWETRYADRVEIGERYPRNPGASSSTINWQGAVESSGSSQKNPAQPTVYVLRAEKGSQSVTKAVLVDMRRAPPAFCTISGTIDRNRMSYRTTVELHRTDASQPVRTARAIGRTFRFDRVPVGKYRIVPKGVFPADENGRPSSLWFFPRVDTLTCRPNGPHGLAFRIGSTEG